MTQRRHILNDDSGFSIAELVTAAAIGLLVLGAAYLLFETGMKAFRQVEGTTIASRGAAQCMMRIERPLREASRMTTATEYDIRFSSDPNDDGSLEAVRFSIPSTATTELRAEIGTSTSVVSKIVRNRASGQPLFTYLSKDGAVLTGADRLNAAIVRVLIITQPDVPGTPPYRLTTDIFLRNYVDSGG